MELPIPGFHLTTFGLDSWCFTNWAMQDILKSLNSMPYLIILIPQHMDRNSSNIKLRLLTSEFKLYYKFLKSEWKLITRLHNKIMIRECLSHGICIPNEQCPLHSSKLQAWLNFAEQCTGRQMDRPKTICLQSMICGHKKQLGAYYID